MDRTVLLDDIFFYESDFRLRIVKRDPELPYSLHSHEFHELVIVEDGMGTNYTEHESQAIRAGSIFCIPPGIKHGYRDVDHLILYNILFDEALLSQNPVDMPDIPGFQALFQNKKEVHYLQITPLQLSTVLLLIHRMQQETDMQEFDKKAKVSAYANFLILLIHLSRFYDEVPRADNLLARHLSGVFIYLDAHKDRQVSTSELTKVANMSASTLNRYFKQCTGLSPIEFHIHERIAYACSLIREAPLPLSEIAEAAGFTDQNYFSRQFRHIMDMSPKQYRRIWVQDSP